MYTINSSQITANCDIGVEVIIVCSTPTSLIDKRSNTPRVPMHGLTRKTLMLHSGEVLGGIVKVVGCNPIDKQSH